ncbi:hypothetical protein EHF33_19895 (plasmid) [Deinococcus psychrotolerans]|uniref:Uncharacterized protein n=1 Tax=Deinococcus psychrotolerans TaxID=2489213 RepID=A0A3G8YLM2_9DEIO|nr:hypothetical protein [Deinococcus psychrotolerans]AZI45177.1 hypothetical protein EHF33_19895 [Deinococcus psychrotolerans]
MSEADFLHFIMAKYSLEIQGLAYALETLDRQLERAQARWAAELSQSQSLEQALNAAHQAQVDVLQRDAILTLQRELQLLSDRLRAENSEDIQTVLAQLSQALERERQDLHVELTTVEQARLQDELKQCQQQHKKQLDLIRADHEVACQQVLAEERQRLTAALEQEAVAQRIVWQQQEQADLERYQADLQAWTERTLGDLRQHLAAEHQRKLDQECAELESQLVEVAQQFRQEQLKTTEAARIEVELVAEGHLNAARQERHQQTGEWTTDPTPHASGSRNAMELGRIKRLARMTVQGKPIPKGEHKFLVHHESAYREQVAVLQAKRVPSDSLFASVDPQVAIQKASLPSEPAVAPVSIDLLVWGYPVPCEVLPDHHPAAVLAALRLIAEHLDVQGEALLRFTPAGQSRRSFMRQIDRAAEGFLHVHEPVILRADREDGPHYFVNNRLPRLTP